MSDKLSFSCIYNTLAETGEQIIRWRGALYQNLT